MNKNILVVAAHPDDEVLGWGGYIAKYSSKGYQVHGVILAEGITSRSDNKKKLKDLKKIKKLHKSTDKSSKILGFKTCKILSYPDNRMYSVDFLNIVKKIEEIILKTKPSIILTHHIGDLNIDHQIAARATITAARPLPNSPVKKILSFETPSSTEWSFDLNKSFKPNHYEDVSKHIKTKLKALKAYSGEMRQFPHPRSLDNVVSLAKFRGSTVGLKFAEAFRIIRSIK